MIREPKQQNNLTKLTYMFSYESVHWRNSMRYTF